MTVGTAWTCNSAYYGRERLVGSALPQQIMGGAAAVCVAAVCAWTFCVNIGSGNASDARAERADKLPITGSPADELAIMRLPQRVAADVDITDFESRFSAAFPPGVFSWTAPIVSGELSMPPGLATTGGSPRQASRRVTENPPTVLRRGHQRGNQLWRPDQRTARVDTDAQPDRPGFFEKIFGKTPQSIFAKLFGSSPAGATLAYANAEEGVATDSAGLTSGLYDRQTAVYDISAHTVYMPDGTALEAHSGLGSRLDDVRYVAERDLGPTPPDIYDLKPREQLFHGVAALRLIPVDEKKVYGRSGLLAHTYMLGANGQSNGCVSFRDYDAFLRAYENHEITRLAVVTHID
jgi:hypothetical protein